MSPLFRIHFVLLLFISTSLFAQEQIKAPFSLVWKTDSILPVPESVLLDKQKDVLYVSLIGGGDHTAVDGNGSIGKLTLKGELIDLQ